VLRLRLFRIWLTFTDAILQSIDNSARNRSNAAWRRTAQIPVEHPLQWNKYASISDSLVLKILPLNGFAGKRKMDVECGRLPVITADDMDLLLIDYSKEHGI
jgi:hypothetical protein